MKRLPTTYVAMIQGNISGKQKLDESYFYTNVDKYNKLTESAFNDTLPDFVIWFESVLIERIMVIKTFWISLSIKTIPLR